MCRTLDSELVGHWKFNGDCTDYSGKENHGHNHRVDLSAVGRSGKPNTAARFDGIDALVYVPDSQSLHFGTGDFTVAGWVCVEQYLGDVVGDIVSKYDEAARTGFNLYVKGSSSTYNSHGDAKNVHFGIDDAVDARWVDCGELWPGNTYVSALTVFDGSLYVGIADAVGDGEDACHVFRYAGGTEWVDCGRVGNNLGTRSVYSMIVHQGNLYCGTGDLDFVKLHRESLPPGRVYRYAGGLEWIDCGQPQSDHCCRLSCLASYQGDLYAGSMDSETFYRYTGGKQWTACGAPGGVAFAMMLHNGHLYASTAKHARGRVYRYEGGDQWTFVGWPARNRQIHVLEVHKGKLIAGTWPLARVCRYEGGTEWTDCGGLGSPQYWRGYELGEIQALTVYNGKLYGGALPFAECYRYDGQQSWKLLGQLATNPQWHGTVVDSWLRLPSLAVFEGTLYAGAGTCQGFADANAPCGAGQIYSITAGANVSYDYDLGTGWKHVVAVRENTGLKLYIDGELVASSPALNSASYDISNREALKIGFGAVDYFSGTMDEMRIYNRALAHDEVRALFALPETDGAQTH